MSSSWLLGNIPRPPRGETGGSSQQLFKDNDLTEEVVLVAVRGVKRGFAYTLSGAIVTEEGRDLSGKPESGDLVPPPNSLHLCSPSGGNNL